MTTSLTGQAGQLNSSLVLGANRTDAENINIIRLAIVDITTPPPDGLTQAQLAKYWMDAYLAELKRWTMQSALRNLMRERAAQEQAIKDAATTDTAL